MEYKWLHISDLHSLSLGIKTKIMQDALLDEIQYIKQNSDFTFILITGDISDKNTGYTEAKALIQKIANKASVPIDKIFIVPGNHDIDRNVPEKRIDICNELWNISILDSKEDYYINKLILGQKDFYYAYNDILGRTYPDKIHFLKIIDEKIAIIHINTAWMCCDSDNETGKLHIGLNTLNNILNDDEIKNIPIKIAIGHHRFSDFNKTVENHLRTMLKTSDIDLYLGGHCHESSIIYDPSINTEFCSCRQARAEDIDYPAGFIVGNINTNDDQNYFEFYNWDSTLSKWTYDYTVNSAKHGKYYLNGDKFKKNKLESRDILIDFKLFGMNLELNQIIYKFDINKPVIYRTALQDIHPKTKKEWKQCILTVVNFYESIIKESVNRIHVFPLAPIPLLVSFGYLMQNNSSNIIIYQYFENSQNWVYNEHCDNIAFQVKYIKKNSKVLAIILSVSAIVKQEDVSAALVKEYDSIEFSIENPKLSTLNYSGDVQQLKNGIKEKLDEIHTQYDELHLFFAAPAGLCLEIGRVIRESMYPDTYVYNYNRRQELKYEKILNLMDLR